MGALVAREDLGPVELDVEHDRPRDPGDGEVAGELVVVASVAHDRRRPERHDLVARGVEEVARSQVGVAIGIVGVDRRQIDLGGDHDIVERRPYAEVRVEAVEAAAHVRQAEMADHEIDTRVVRVEGPAAGGERQRGAGGGVGGEGGGHRLLLSACASSMFL